MAVGDLIRAAESGGDNYAQNPNSTASGPDQFLDRTWLDTIKVARPDLAGQPDEALLALKTNPQISGQVRDTYAAQNGAILSQAGHPVTPGNTYLAHFAGPGGAVSVLNADPSTPVAQILPGAMKANPFLSGMTAGDLRNWADRKMGGGQGPSAASAGRLNAIPPAAAPMFPPQPQQAQQAPQSPETAPMAQIPPMGAPPIFAPQRKAIALAQLRAAFQQPSFYNRG